jgi:hypothetical protein
MRREDDSICLGLGPRNDGAAFEKAGPMAEGPTARSVLLNVVQEIAGVATSSKPLSLVWERFLPRAWITHRVLNVASGVQLGDRERRVDLADSSKPWWLRLLLRFSFLQEESLPVTSRLNNGVEEFELSNGYSDDVALPLGFRVLQYPDGVGWNSSERAVPVSADPWFSCTSTKCLNAQDAYYWTYLARAFADRFLFSEYPLRFPAPVSVHIDYGFWGEEEDRLGEFFHPVWEEDAFGRMVLVEPGEIHLLSMPPEVRDPEPAVSPYTIIHEFGHYVWSCYRMSYAHNACANGGEGSEERSNEAFAGIFADLVIAQRFQRSYLVSPVWFAYHDEDYENATHVADLSEEFVPGETICGARNEVRYGIALRQALREIMLNVSCEDSTCIFPIAEPGEAVSRVVLEASLALVGSGGVWEEGVSVDEAVARTARAVAFAMAEGPSEERLPLDRMAARIFWYVLVTYGPVAGAGVGRVLEHHGFDLTLTWEP